LGAVGCIDGWVIEEEGLGDGIAAGDSYIPPAPNMGLKAIGLVNDVIDFLVRLSGVL
jgi:hypothetical protein